MPGLALVYDSNGDYVDDGAGGFLETATPQPATHHQLLDTFGAWVGDHAAGRDRQGNKRRASTQREADIETDSILEALRPLQEAGLIDDVDVQSERQLNRFVHQVTSRDRRSGATITFDELQSFGV